MFSRKTVQGDDNNLVFSNKDCERCFLLVPRELHFLLKTLAKFPACKNLFNASLFDAIGAGNHRKLNYDEFYIVGLLKLLNNAGFSVPISAHIIGKKIFNASTSIKMALEHLFMSSTLHIKAPDDFSSITTNNLEVCMVTTHPVNAADTLFTVALNLTSYNNHLSNYVERYFVVEN